MIYLILAIIILSIICFFSIKSNFKSSKKAKEQKVYIDKITDVLFENNKIENDKTEIREEYDEKENSIDNNTDIDNGVLSINATKKSGKFPRTN